MIYHLQEKDLTPFETGEGKQKVVTYVNLPNVTAGFGLLEKGDAFRNWTYWYEEVVYVVRGRASFTVSLPPYTSQERNEIKSGDLFYIGKGHKVSIEPIGEEPFLALFVATPNPGVE